MSQVLSISDSSGAFRTLQSTLFSVIDDVKECLCYDHKPV